MAKALCKQKDIEKKIDKYIEQVKGAKYVCTKCGRAARKAKSLCKPYSMS